MAKAKSSGPSAPLWALSYGDMLTNMLCFFVMLMIFAKFDASERTKMKETKALEEAYSAAFSLTPEKGAHQWLVAGGKGILLVPPRKKTYDIPQIAAKVRKALQTISIKDKILVLSDDRMVKIRIPSHVLFEKGSAILKPESEEILTALLPIISEIDNNIRVDGHTDDLPTRNQLFPSNWELSAARACAVVRFYIEKFNQDPMRFSAQGFAEFQPIASNLTEIDRQKNRRVEIVILTSKPKKEPSYKWE